MPAKSPVKSRTKHIKKAAVVTPPQEISKDLVPEKTTMDQNSSAPQIIPDPQASVTPPVQTESSSPEPVSSQVSQLANLSQSPVSGTPVTSQPVEASTVITPPVSTPPPVLSSSIESASSKPSKVLWIMVIIFLLIGVVVAGTAAYNWSKSTTPSTSQTPVVTETTPVPTTVPPTVTPSASLDKSLISIQVLNGTGEPGLAGKVKAALQEAGFNDISTGNADAYTYSKTILSIKEEKVAYTQDVLSALKSLYPQIDTPSTLSATSNYDAIITIGKN